MGGLAIGELLQEENQTAAQVTVLSGGRDRAQATGPKAAERQVNEKPRRENKPDKPSVQAVTINLADLQAGKKICTMRIQSCFIMSRSFLWSIRQPVNSEKI